MLLRQRFRRWRQDRPFWGAALTILAGIELFLSGRMDLAVGGMVLQFGFSGLQTTVLPLVIVLAGVLVLLQPVHHIFYGVITLALSVYSLVSVNLGGLGIGMVLGIAGSIVVVSWMAKDPGRATVPAQGGEVAGDVAARDAMELLRDGGSRRGAAARRSAAVVLSGVLAASGLNGALPASSSDIVEGPCYLGFVLCGQVPAWMVVGGGDSADDADAVEAACAEGASAETAETAGTADTAEAGAVVDDGTSCTDVPASSGVDDADSAGGAGAVDGDGDDAVADDGVVGDGVVDDGVDDGAADDGGVVGDGGAADDGVAADGVAADGVGADDPPAPVAAGEPGATADEPGLTVGVPDGLPLPDDEALPVILGGNDDVDVYAVPAELRASDLSISGIRAVALVAVRVGGDSGQRRNALKIVADRVVVSGFALRTYAGASDRAAGTETLADSVTMDGRATMYLSSITLDGPSGPLTISADDPPPTLTSLILAATNPTIGLLGATSDTQIWSGFRETVWSD